MGKSPSILRITHPLLRHLEWPKLAMDALLLSAAGIAAAIVMLFASQTVIDATAFHAGMDYATVGTMSDADVTFAQTKGVSVISKSAATDTGVNDLSDSISVTGWAYPEDTQVQNLAHLLDSNILSGEVNSQGVILDEATAQLLGIDVGEPVHLYSLGADELIECESTVSAIIRPYRDPNEVLSPGLTIFPTASCEPLTQLATSQISYNLNDTSTDSEVTSKSEFTAQVLRAALAPQASGALVPLLALSLLFWGVTTVRVATRLRAQLSEVTRILHEQGVPLNRLRGVFSTGLIILCSGVGILSISAAHLLIFQIASFWTQWLHVWILTIILILVSALIAAITYRNSRWMAQEVTEQ